MTNTEILQENFLMQKTYTKMCKSAQHVDTILKCNSSAHSNAIGTIDNIVIESWDEIVIVRSEPISDQKLSNYLSPNAEFKYDITEYRRKPQTFDGETMTSEQLE